MIKKSLLLSLLLSSVTFSMNGGYKTHSFVAKLRNASQFERHKIVNDFRKSNLEKIQRKPIMLSEEELIAQKELIAPYFDEAYYMKNYGKEVEESGLSAIDHYLRIGYWNELNPAQWFDSALYAKQFHFNENPFVNWIKNLQKNPQNRMISFKDQITIHKGKVHLIETHFFNEDPLAMIYNPSIIDYKNRTIISFRISNPSNNSSKAWNYGNKIKFIDDLYVGELQEDLSVKRLKKINTEKFPNIQDARFFTYLNKLYVSFVVYGGQHKMPFMQFARLTDELEFETFFTPNIEGNCNPSSHEKNWLFFENAERLHVLCGINQQKSLYIFEQDLSMPPQLVISRAYDLNWQKKDMCGLVRNSTTPIWIDEKETFLTSFHVKNFEHTQKIFYYDVFFGLINTNGQLTHVSKESFLKSDFCKLDPFFRVSCLLPFGAIRKHNNLRLSFGKDDQKCYIADLPIDKIFQSFEPVKLISFDRKNFNFNKSVALVGGFYTFANDFISQEIQYKGTFSAHLQELLREIRKIRNKARNLVDIGAHIGTLSIPLSNTFDHIYAIEANPITYSLLCKNITHNKKENITPLHVALGMPTKEFDTINVPIFESGNEKNTGGISLLENIRVNKKDTTVINPSKEAIVSLKSLDDLNLENISMIKIDIEGMEYDVLCGALKTLETNQFPDILIEIFNAPYYADQKKSIFELLLAQGYCLYRYGVSDDYLCIHKSKPLDMHTIPNCFPASL